MNLPRRFVCALRGRWCRREDITDEDVIPDDLRSLMEGRTYNLAGYACQSCDWINFTLDYTEEPANG